MAHEVACALDLVAEDSARGELDAKALRRQRLGHDVMFIGTCGPHRVFDIWTRKALCESDRAQMEIAARDALDDLRKADREPYDRESSISRILCETEASDAEVEERAR